MTRPHTLKPQGIEGPLYIRQGDVIVVNPPFALHELQELQELLAQHHIALADLVAVVRRYPKSIAAMAQDRKGA